MPTIHTLVGFSRPHTIIATTIQVLTIYLIVAARQQPFLDAIGPLGLTLVACLALNLFVVGVNQITDVAIDKVNKPWLPIAAERLSPTAARWVCTSAAVLSLLAATLAGPLLLLTVCLIMLIGAAYSLPPLRLKRFPFVAAFSIALARGFLANVGLALHYRDIFGGAIPVVTLALIGLFFFGFGLVIAIYKDMPDAAGDQLYKIETFTTRLGTRRVLQIGRAVLSFCYALPIIVAIPRLPGADALFLLISHLLLIGSFWAGSLRVDLSRQRSIATFYTFLWTLFYTEFFVLSIYELTRSTI